MGDVAHHAFLPVLTLSLSAAHRLYLLTRNTLITVTTKDYIRTARAKGLGERSSGRGTPSGMHCSRW